MILTPQPAIVHNTQLYCRVYCNVLYSTDLPELFVGLEAAPLVEEPAQAVAGVVDQAGHLSDNFQDGHEETFLERAGLQFNTSLPVLPSPCLSTD